MRFFVPQLVLSSSFLLLACPKRHSFLHYQLVGLKLNIYRWPTKNEENDLTYNSPSRKTMTWSVFIPSTSRYMWSIFDQTPLEYFHNLFWYIGYQIQLIPINWPVRSHLTLNYSFPIIWFSWSWTSFLKRQFFKLNFAILITGGTEW